MLRLFFTECIWVVACTIMTCAIVVTASYGGKVCAWAFGQIAHARHPSWLTWSPGKYIMAEALLFFVILSGCGLAATMIRYFIAVVRYSLCTRLFHR